MKVTIDLAPQEVKGIIAYLKETEGRSIDPTTKDIKDYIKGIVSGTLYNPREAVSDYINGNI